MKFEFNFVKPGVFNLPETDWWGFVPNDHIEIQPHWTLAHLAVEMELFHQSDKHERMDGMEKYQEDLHRRKTSVK